MRLFVRLVVALFGMAAMVGLGALPANAQSDVTRPSLADLRSVELNYVITFNGEPGAVCQERYASANRYHGTCRQLVNANYPEINIDFVAGRVIEYVYYDGTAYQRRNDERTWQSFRDTNYNPQLTLNQLLFNLYINPTDMVVTNIGRTNVGGTATTQYQFWSTNADVNAAAGGQYVYDVFVSDQNYALKDQESQRGTFPMGEGELARIWTYSNINGAISVSAPPAENVRAARVALPADWNPVPAPGAGR